MCSTGKKKNRVVVPLKNLHHLQVVLKFAAYVDICMKLAKIDVLVTNENMGLCLYMLPIPK